jgi:hypothetical protein
VSKTPRTNFTSVRVKRDILRRSAVGLILTNTFAIHGHAWRIEPGLRAETPASRSFPERQLRRLLARSDTTAEGRTTILPGALRVHGRRYGGQAQYMKVGDNLHARKWASCGATTCGWSLTGWRSSQTTSEACAYRSIRQFTSQGTGSSTSKNGAGQLETRVRDRPLRRRTDRTVTRVVGSKRTQDYELAPEASSPWPGALSSLGRRLFVQPDHNRLRGMVV